MKAFVEFQNPVWPRLATAEAVARQRAAGRVRGYEYPSDEAALADFCHLHWGVETE